jgi:hypothetical protein
MNLKAIAVSTAVVFMAGCKKDRDESSGFRAEGYWKGYVHINQAAVLNLPGGFTRLYYNFTGTDTASATFKLNGSYSQTGAFYKAVYPAASDTFFLDSHTSTKSTFTGVLWTSSSSEAGPFSLLKQ